MDDRQVLKHIQELVNEEQKLMESAGVESENKARLEEIQVELDQCWDLLRQRRALRDAGEDPDKAQLRPPETVENYEQ